MTQTFSGIPNSLRGLAIGRKGAIQKLVTGRGARDVGFMLERYSVEDDTIADYFKIVIRGTARDVLCAQRFIFNHIRTSYQKPRKGVLPAGSRVMWTYDDELKSFVMEFKASARGQSVRSFLSECQARPTPPMLPTAHPLDQEDLDQEADLNASSADECNIADCDECAHHRREAERALGETLPPGCVRTHAWIAEGGLAAWIAPVP
jgi:hypothetical protein